MTFDWMSRLPSTRDHGVLEPVLQRGRRAVNFRLIAEQWDRIGQFYAAFPAGHATASAALQRLNRFQASNRFYAANPRWALKHLSPCYTRGRMQVIALLSTKGGAGKTALATALAVEMGAVVLDLDPQASACRWRDRREAAFPVVTDVAPARLRPTLDAARARRVATVVLDTPPRSETAALEAARAADLVIVPCRPQIVDPGDGADDDPGARPRARSPRRGRARRDPPKPDCYYCNSIRGRGDAADVQRYVREGVGAFLR